MSDRNDDSNIQGDPDVNPEADTASGGAPQDDDSGAGTDDTTDSTGAPVDNPSGG